MVRCRSSQDLPVQSVPILLPWKRSFIHKQAKRPLDLPLMPLVIVSPDDTLSQQKLKLIPASGAEDDDSRPEWSRQHPGDQPPVRQGLIKGMQQRRHATVKDASPTKPAVWSTGPGTRPRSSAASDHARRPPPGL